METQTKSNENAQVVKAIGLTTHPEVGKLADHLETIYNPIPEPIGKQVVVQIKAGTLYSDDIAIAQGTALGRFLGPKHIDRNSPYIPGSSFSGIVAAVGDNVTQFKCGDAVVHALKPTGGNGAWAEYICIDEDKLVHKPEDISFQDATIAIVAGTVAYGMFRNAHIQKGDRCVIAGASGGIGTVLLQMLKAHGAYVYAVCSSRNADFVRSLGADEVIPYDQTSTVEYLQSRGIQIDKAFDIVGGKDIERDLVRNLKSDGRFVTVCGPEKYIGSRKMSWLEVIKMFGYVSIRVFGSMVVRPRYVFSEVSPRGVMNEVFDFITTHNLVFPVDASIPLDLESIQEAVERLSTHRVRGRIIILP